MKTRIDMTATTKYGGSAAGPVLFLLLLWSAAVFATSDRPSESDVWNAVSKHVRLLQSRKEYSRALNELAEFEKQYPRSRHVPEALLIRSEIHFGPLGNLDAGFRLLERAESGLSAAGLKRARALRERFGSRVTEKRLSRIRYYLERYFSRRQEFPESLSRLCGAFPGLKKSDLKDGFGFPFQYARKDSPVFAGEDAWNFRLFSAGPDGTPGTEDDLDHSAASGGGQSEADIVVVETFRENGAWKAEIVYRDPERNKRLRKTVARGDAIGTAEVFGIREKGVVLQRNGALERILK
jgi:hypothetical protein